MDKKRLIRIFIPVLCVMLLGSAAVGITAAFLSRSPGEVQNIITAGSVEGKLMERNWEPENAKHLHPLESTPKDPSVKNTGDNDAYIFLEVRVPVENISVVDGNGKKTVRQAHELFTFKADTENWELISRNMDKGAVRYVYGYKKAVSPKEETAPLFEEVTAVNYLEGELNALKTYNVEVNCKMIQSNVETDKLPEVYSEFLKQSEADAQGGKA